MTLSATSGLMHGSKSFGLIKHPLQDAPIANHLLVIVPGSMGWLCPKLG